MSVGVVLLAAGSSRRFGSRCPKQLTLIGKTPLFLHSLRTISSMKEIREIGLVVPPREVFSYQKILQKEKHQKKIKLVEGGAFRGESVKNGVLSFSSLIQIVLIHDAARPLVTPEVVHRVGQAARQFGVSVAAWPVSDTVKMTNGNSFVKKTLLRDRLWLAQTPQGFKMSIAKRVLLHPSKSITDDVGLAEKKGYRVRVVHGDSRNLKVTFPHDLRICKALLSHRS